jgi:hypothetical protein
MDANVIPMLYDSSWAYVYWPNYSWMIIVGALVFFGFLGKESISGKYQVALPVIILLIFAVDLLGNHHKNEAVFQAAQLPSKTGGVANSNRLAEQNVDQPGFINYGPYFPLRKGRYEVTISYKSSAVKSEVVGWADVYNATSGKKLIQIPIQGTDDNRRELIIEFESTQRKLNLFEFRTHWNGVSNLEVQDIVLREK